MAREITFEFGALDTGVLHGEFRGVPRHSGVFRIFDLNDRLVLLERTHNLALRLKRFYSESPPPGALDLREIGERIEFCPTDSPFESVYLLYRERRRWFPKTYRRMRTFPQYHLLAVDPSERFPRVALSREVRSGIRYFGPFRSRKIAENVRAAMERTFRIRPCDYDIQGDVAYPDCLYFQMQTCSRPCNGDMSRDAYLNDVESAISWIRGDQKDCLETMFARIAALSEETRFEEAEQIRLQIERARNSDFPDGIPVLEVGRFNYVVLMRARSKRARKIATIRGGSIVSIEEHDVASIEDTLATSLLATERASPHQPGNAAFVYDEFCLAVGFLARSLPSARFFTIEGGIETAHGVAEQLHSSGTGPGPSPSSTGA